MERRDVDGGMKWLKQKGCGVDQASIIHYITNDHMYRHAAVGGFLQEIDLRGLSLNVSTLKRPLFDSC